MGELLFMMVLVAPLPALMILFWSWLGILSLNTRPINEFSIAIRGAYSSIASKNDDIWDYARYYHHRVCKKICIFVIFIAEICYILWFMFLKELSTLPLVVFFCEYFLYVLYAGLKTTEQLNKTFDRQGNRREEYKTEEEL